LNKPDAAWIGLELELLAGMVARVEAFRLWLDVLDRSDVPAMRRATRKLRDFRVSICTMAPPARQGGVS
jgi:hypothetical protein